MTKKWERNLRNYYLDIEEVDFSNLRSNFVSTTESKMTPTSLDFLWYIAFNTTLVVVKMRLILGIFHCAT